jgi:hypothetical protein
MLIRASWTLTFLMLEGRIVQKSKTASGPLHGSGMSTLSSSLELLRKLLPRPFSRLQRINYLEDIEGRFLSPSPPLPGREEEFLYP